MTYFDLDRSQIQRHMAQILNNGQVINILLLVHHRQVCCKIRVTDLSCSFKRQYNLPFIIYFVQIMCSHPLEITTISLHLKYNINQSFWITYISVVYVYKRWWCICTVINYFLLWTPFDSRAWVKQRPSVCTALVMASYM